MPWLGYELTAEEELELVARGEAAKRWRASSGDERAARKRTRIVSGGYVSPLSRCGGNSWFYAAHSDSSYPQYRLAGKPPGCGLFRPAEAFPNVTAWHWQGGVPGIPEAEYQQSPGLQLGERLELIAGEGVRSRSRCRSTRFTTRRSASMTRMYQYVLACCNTLVL